MKYGMQRARESLIRSLIQGNVFHILILRLVTKKAKEFLQGSKFQSSVIGDIIIIISGHFSELREGGLQVVFISLGAKFALTSTPKQERTHLCSLVGLSNPRPSKEQKGRVMAGRLFSVYHTTQRRNDQGEASCQRLAIALFWLKSAQGFDKGSWKTPVINISS